jgi:uncharacterized protein
METGRSALYRGRVRHTRMQPFHQFTYRVYYGLFDIDELDALDAKLRLFSVDRFNVFGFNRADHGPADGRPLRPWAEALLAQAGVDIGRGRIQLLALPRILGHVFDPISVWYCHDEHGTLRAVLYEVRNTFGDRHTYVAPVGEGPIRHTATKAMHVSPFNGMDQTYQFAMSRPAERLGLTIAVSAQGHPLFRAGMQLSRLPFTDRNLARLFVTHPLLTLKVVAGIHWQALRLWLKGVPFHRRPEPPQHDASVAHGPAVAA